MPILALSVLTSTALQHYTYIAGYVHQLRAWALNYILTWYMWEQGCRLLVAERRGWGCFTTHLPTNCLLSGSLQALSALDACHMLHFYLVTSAQWIEVMPRMFTMYVVSSL